MIAFLLAPLGRSPLNAIDQETLKGLNGNNDHCLWLDEWVIVPIEPSVKARFQFIQRWGKDCTVFYEERASIFLDYSFLSFFKNNPSIKSINATLGYSSHYELASSNQSIFNWIWFSRYTLEGTVSVTCKEWDINQRGQINYICYHRKHYSDFGQYRHRMELWTPWKFTKYHVRPYLSNEWFFRPNTYSRSHPSRQVGNWYQNRLRFGVGITMIPEKLVCNLYWQWRTNKQKPLAPKAWNSTYDYGLSLFYYM